MIKNEIKVLDDISHILLRAGMYIGSVSLENHTQFINGTFGTHTFCTGLIKLIEETYINSIDEAIRTNFKFANKISISIENDFASGWQVCVKDNGRGLPQNMVIDTKGDKLPGAVAAWTIPKAGGNFDDSAGRMTAGMNGMGVSLTNIFSKRFIGITADGKNEITLQCNDNLSNFEWNSIPAKYNGTSVTFTPDFSRFESDGFSNTDIEIIKDQITTLAVIYPKIEFTFNNEKIIGNFKKYAKIYDESAIILENDNHMIALCRSEDGFRQLSYVNSIHTKVGGTHIDFIMDELTNELIPQIKKKHKVEISKARIKECITLITFIKDMPNLRFDSQTKERLTSPFGEIKSHLNLDIVKLAKTFMNNDDLLTPIIELAVARKEAADKRTAAANLKKAQKKKIANHIAANDKDPENKTIFIAEGFCVDAESEVYTTNGIKKIRDIQIGDYVMTHKHAFKQVTSISPSLKCGIKVNGRIYSKEHRLYVYNKANNIFEFEQVGNLDKHIHQLVKNNLIAEDITRSLHKVELIEGNQVYLDNGQLYKFSDIHQILILKENKITTVTVHELNLNDIVII